MQYTVVGERVLTVCRVREWVKGGSWCVKWKWWEGSRERRELESESAC